MVAKISVVIPCFNCVTTIENAFNSIINQTLLPDQIILVNDCSTDSTLELLNKIASNVNVDTKIINLNFNSGPAAARNIGIDHSRNDLIAFLDSDDTWHPKKLELQIKLMNDNPTCNISGHKIIYTHSDSKQLMVRDYSFRKISFKEMLFKNYLNTPSVIIRRSKFRFPFEYRYSEDYYLWLTIANQGSDILFINEALGYVHKPFYGHSGLSASLKLMHKYEVLTLKHFRSCNSSYYYLISLAIYFSKIKYFIRLIRTSFQRNSL